MARTTKKKTKSTGPGQSSVAVEKLFAALVKAQAKFPAVARTQVAEGAPSDGQAYAFADLGAVITSVRAPLTEQGLCIVQRPCGPPRKGLLQIETLIVHESGEWIGGTVWLPVEGKDPREHGAVITYGRKYGLMGLLGLATADDDAASLAVALARQAGGLPSAVSEDLRAELGDLEEAIRRSESPAEMAGLVAAITAMPPAPRGVLRRLYGERLAAFGARKSTRAA
jgi:hypothetical protein